MPVGLIREGPANQLRAPASDDELASLADNIAALGLQNPVAVRRIPGAYELVQGSRRVAAFRKLGRDTIPAFVAETASDLDTARAAAENIARKDLNPLEEGLALRTLISTHGDDLTTLARLVGRSEEWCGSRLALLDYPDVLQEAIYRRQIGLGAAAHLALIPDAAELARLVHHAILHGCSEATARYWLQQAQSSAPLVTAEGALTPAATPTSTVYVTRVRCQICRTEHPMEAVQLLRVCGSCHDQIAKVLSAQQ